MKMKRLIGGLSSLLFSLPLMAQTTVVSATQVVDTDGFNWVNGTYHITFVPAPGWPTIGSYHWTGGNLQQNSIFDGTISAGTTGGVTSVVLTSYGTYTVCPASATFTGGGGSGASGTPSCFSEGGNLHLGAIVNLVPGSGYTSNPTLVLSGGTGSGAAGYGQVGGGGAFSVPIPDNSTITPSGSQWAFTLCPNASSGCFTVNQPVNGPSLDITSLLATFAKGPRFSAAPTAFGYGTVEVNTTPKPGSIFFNTTSLACEQWSGFSWLNCGSGSPFTYPPVGIANSTGSAWGSSYNSSNQIPVPFLPIATSTTNGIVRPDNSTITITSGGVLSATGGGGGGSPPAGGVGDVQLYGTSTTFAAAPNTGFNYNTTNQTLTVGNQNTLASNQVLTSPGWNFGSPGTGTSVGSLVTNMYNMNVYAYGQGNHSILGGSNIDCMANGDCNVGVANGGYSGASIDGSGQGYTGLLGDQMTIAPTKVYTANASSTGTPSGYPGVTLTVTSFNSGSLGVGRWLIDKTTGVQAFTATGATQQGSGTNIYSAITETGQSFTASKIGSLSAAVNGPTVPNPNNLPILATFTVTISSTCSTGDQFTIGGINIESAKLVSASYASGTMTATAYLRSSHESGAYFACEGPTGRLMEQNIDETSGNRFLFIVLGAINSTTLAVAREAQNGMDAAYLNGFGTDTVYPGARVVDARDPSTASTCAGQACITGNITLAETTATFTSGDALEIPNGLTQIESGRILLNMAAFNPMLTGTTLNWGCPSGSTECGGYVGGYVSTFANNNPTSNYTLNGGRWTLKGLWKWSGTIGALNTWDSLPQGAVNTFQVLANGTTNLFQANDADFFDNVAETSGHATTRTMHAGTFNFAGPSGGAAAFNFNGTANWNNLSTTGTCAFALDIDSSNNVFKATCPTGGGGSGNVNDGSGTTTPGILAESTSTAHVIDWLSGVTLSSGNMNVTGSVTAGSGASGHYVFIASGTPPTGLGSGVVYSTTSGGAPVISYNGGTTYTPLRPWSCQPGLGDGTNAITAATYHTTTCRNETGQTITLTAIRCYSDNNGGSTCNVTNSSSTALLTGAVTATNSYANGTQSSTVTLASGDYLLITYVADGTSKQIGIDVVGSY